MAQRNRSVFPKTGKARAALTITHPNAAGIDIGSASHFVAVPPDRDDHPVREFASFTADLNALADWLRACGVDRVAMESTGVYWIPLFERLEARGFTVLLVNARSLEACKVPGGPSTCSRSGRRWVRSTSWARSSPSAMPRSSGNCKASRFTTPILPKARSAGVPAMRRSSICARSCSRCAAWT